MGQLDRYGLSGLSLQDLANRYGVRPATTADLPLAANTQANPWHALNDLSNADIWNLHGQTAKTHGETVGRWKRLMELQNGSPPQNYEEARVLQKGLDSHIRDAMSKAAQSDTQLRMQSDNLRARGLVSPFEQTIARGLHMPNFPNPQQQTANPDPQPRFLGTPSNENEPTTE